MRSNRNFIVGRLVAAIALAGVVFWLVAAFHTVAGRRRGHQRCGGRAIGRAAN
ncbi:MAG: entericidin [Burkholderia sp.]